MNIKESPIPLPTDEVTDPYVFEERKKLSKKYSYDESKGGKWMMFVGKEFLNNVWLMAVRSYRRGELIGIRSIKSTTAQANEKSNGEPRGVISFHCGPYDNEKLIRKYGRNIKDKLTSQQIYRGLFGYLIYKSDQQTKDGIFRPKKGVKAKFRGKERCSLYRYLIGSGHSFTELDTDLVNSERYLTLSLAEDAGENTSRTNFVFHVRSSDQTILTKSLDPPAKLGAFAMYFMDHDLVRHWETATTKYFCGNLAEIAYLELHVLKGTNCGKITFVCLPEADVDRVRECLLNLYQGQLIMVYKKLS